MSRAEEQSDLVSTLVLGHCGPTLHPFATFSGYMVWESGCIGDGRVSSIPQPPEFCPITAFWYHLMFELLNGVAKSGLKNSSLELD